MNATKKQPNLRAFDALISDLTKQREEVHARLQANELILHDTEAELKTALDTLASQNAEITKLTKDLAQEKSLKDGFYKTSQDQKKILDQLHNLLDGLQGTLPRMVDVEKSYGCSKEEVCVITRFASYLGALVAR